MALHPHMDDAQQSLANSHNSTVTTTTSATQVHSGSMQMRCHQGLCPMPAPAVGAVMVLCKPKGHDV